MKTSSFLTALHSNAGLPLGFRVGGNVIPAGYHLTEVKRVSYETMDCGAVAHRWSENHFELWVPPLAAFTPGHDLMRAGKFLGIIDRVETALPLAGEATARIHASFAGQPAALYDVDGVAAGDGTLWVELTPDRTRCKAAERTVASVAGACCGEAAEAPEKKESPAASCGCAAPAVTACCA